MKLFPSVALRSLLLIAITISICHAAPDGPRYSGSVEDRPVSSRLDTREQLRVGINRTNLPWKGEMKEQLAILADIERLGAENIRLAWVEPFERGYEHIAECNRLGLPITLMIPHSAWNLHYPPDVQFREKRPHLLRMPRLSQLNVDAYNRDLEAMLKNFRDRGLWVEAIQPFNEINWADFNGDFPYIEGGLIIDSENWKNYDFVERWAEGVRKYGAVLKAGREILDRVFENSPVRAPILLTAGAGYPPPHWVAKAGGVLVEPKLFYGILDGTHPLSQGGENFFEYPDALGIHLYPAKGDLDPETAMKTAKAAVWKKLTPLLAVAGHGKPIFITEFGYNGWQWGNQDRDEYKRLLNTRILLEALCDAEFKSIKFGPIQFFDYDHMPPFSVYENGRLHPSALIFQERYFINE